MSTVNVESFKRPIVELTSNFKLQRTERMSNALETITKRMSVVVERIDAPFITNMGMSMVFDSVNNWISESGIRTFIVDFSTK